MDTHDVAETAAMLRRLLVEIDAGTMTADDDQRAYLIGAADALDAVAGRGISGLT